MMLCVLKNAFINGKMCKFYCKLPSGMDLYSIDDIAAAIVELGFPEYPRKMKVQPLSVDSGKVMYILSGGPRLWKTYDLEKARAFWDPYFSECLNGVFTLGDLVNAFRYIKRNLLIDRAYEFISEVGSIYDEKDEK